MTMTSKDQVRLLISDVGGEDNATFLFTDKEIENFLELRGGDVRRAAATAMRTMAGNEAMVLKVIKFMELSTDGAKTADALRKNADAIEDEAKADDEESENGIDVIEMNLGPNSDRELELNKFRRRGF